MENITEDKYECEQGWWPLIEDAKRIVNEFNLKQSNIDDIILEFVQIKEKWGGLRLYLNEYVPEIADKIHEIENKSYKICEHCGTSENVKTEYTHSWVMTLCDKCREEEIKKFNERYK